jgi:murein DD-endopeptidase MepM/ murein hydrolase activator NlpD
MGKKFLSLIVVPHTKAGYRSYSVSRKSMKILAWSSACIALLLLAVLGDYVYIRVSRKSYKALVRENLQQQQMITEYRGSIDKLKSRVEKFEEYAKKLNIMAGLSSPEILKELGIGGESLSSENGQSLPIQNPPPQLSLGNVKEISKKAEDIESNLNTLLSVFESQTLKLACTPSIWPTKGWMSSAFGMRTDPFTGKRAFHKGIDIVTNQGNPVISTADGIVVQVKYEPIGGNTVIISHREGVSTVYCHLSKFLVKAGKKVKRGDVIGLIGRTGKASGPHLHYEVRINGKSVNPYFYILEEEEE